MTDHGDTHCEQVEFFESDLNRMLADKVCGDCPAYSCDDSDCPGECIGTEVLLEIDEQIAVQAIKFAKQLRDEWLAGSVD